MEPEDDKTQTHVTLTRGTMVGHYRIVDKIGAGGMGEVYLAEDTDLNRKVALKFLAPHLCLDGDCRKRFKREAQAAAKLDHPNIVPVYEVSEHQGRPYFSMAHIEGQSLRDVIKEDKLNATEAIDFAMQICEGLQDAHEAGVVHRDVKPSNIIIDSKGRPRLLDFGLATISSEEKLTKTGSTLGTVGYMSPEQIEGTKVDHRSDLFSVGVILYELLTGRKPFTGDTDMAVAHSITDTTPEPVARYKSGTTGKLQQIVDKALSKDPSLRYQHADDMLADLKRLSSESTSPKKSRLFPWIAAGIVIVVGVYFGYTGLISDRTVTEQPERKMLAVLPFENLGAPEDEYFADGITEEITSRLAAVHSLGIISRTSAYSYKNTDKTLPQIARELGVDYILEGTLRWDKTEDSSRVLVTPQLIDVTHDTHIWSDRYERYLTDIFAVQKDIAVHVVEALDVNLFGKDALTLAKQPTTNTEAYEYYLRGREYYNKGQADEAISSLEKAIDIDPVFAQAHAYLSLAYVAMARVDSNFAVKAHHSAKKAQEIDRDVGEGHLALGMYHYIVKTEYEKAASEFVLALEHIPNNSDALLLLGLARRRQGHWDEAQHLLKRVIELDPLNSNAADNYVSTAFLTGQLDEPLDILTEMVQRFPSRLDFRSAKALLTAMRDGPSAKLRDDIRHIVSLLSTVSPSITEVRAAKFLPDLAMYLRDYSTARHILDYMRSHWPKIMVAGSDLALISYYTYMGELNNYDDRPVESKSYFDSSRSACEVWMAKGAEHGKIYAQLRLARVYAALQQRDDALTMLDTLYVYTDRTGDAFFLIQVKETAIHIHLLLSDYDLAIDQLEEFMKETHFSAVTELQYHPFWDPLRDHPRFQALLEKYEKKHGI